MRHKFDFLGLAESRSIVQRLAESSDGALGGTAEAGHHGLGSSCSGDGFGIDGGAADLGSSLCFRILGRLLREGREHGLAWLRLGTDWVIGRGQVMFQVGLGKATGFKCELKELALMDGEVWVDDLGIDVDLVRL
ncbi:hypothetical protein M0R45_017464 [Rubus argutus]|uniref:Uncharacterized protein n=1 Tax=Rubus argutus TaxID=59490 RepID=A0AAW1XVT2_RUBAR